MPQAKSKPPEVELKSTRRSVSEIMETVARNGREELERSTYALAFSGFAGDGKSHRWHVSSLALLRDDWQHHRRRNHRYSPQLWTAPRRRKRVKHVIPIHIQEAVCALVMI